MNIIFFIFIFIICIYLLYLHKGLLNREVNNIDRNLQRQEEKLALLKDKDRNLIERNKQLEKSLNEIVTIYEYVKRLGSTMDFGDAIETLKGTLSSLVRFGAGKLILFEDKKISGVYEISAEKGHGGKKEAASLVEYENKVVLKMLNTPHTLLYEKGKLSSLGTFPRDVETLLALPLTVEKHLVGIITLENIPLMNVDKIYFIALQFAMEVKKTQLYEKVKELSTIDGLTSLYLRRHFSNLLANELDRGYRQGQVLSFLMMDVDNFKRYNDEYGHLVGDLILRKIAGILKEKSREIDILCRYGGDEFVLALPRTILQDAQIVAERLRRAVNEYPFRLTHEQFQVSISIGVSSCNPKDMRGSGISSALIDSADKAMYEAKMQGRNRVVFAI